MRSHGGQHGACTVEDPAAEGSGGATAGASAQTAGTGGSGSPGAGTTGVQPSAGTTGIISNGGMGGGASGGISAGGIGVGGSGVGGAGGPPGGPYTVPRGKSAGCGKQSGTDEPGKYTSHDIEVTGVDQYWLTMKKPYAGQAPYTFTHRAFAVRLPTNYDPSKAYPVVFQGGGCGNTDGTSGKTGGDKLIPDANIADGIAVGLSYVFLPLSHVLATAAPAVTLRNCTMFATERARCSQIQPLVVEV